MQRGRCTRRDEHLRWFQAGARGDLVTQRVSVGLRVVADVGLTRSQQHVWMRPVRVQVRRQVEHIDRVDAQRGQLGGLDASVRDFVHQ